MGGKNLNRLLFSTLVALTTAAVYMSGFNAAYQPVNVTPYGAPEITVAPQETPAPEETAVPDISDDILSQLEILKSWESAMCEEKEFCIQIFESGYVDGMIALQHAIDLLVWRNRSTIKLESTESEMCSQDVESYFLHGQHEEEAEYCLPTQIVEFLEEKLDVSIEKKTPLEFHGPLVSLYWTHPKTQTPEYAGIFEFRIDDPEFLEVLDYISRNAEKEGVTLQMEPISGALFRRMAYTNDALVEKDSYIYINNIAVENGCYAYVFHCLIHEYLHSAFRQSEPFKGALEESAVELLSAELTKEFIERYGYSDLPMEECDYSIYFEDIPEDFIDLDIYGEMREDTYESSVVEDLYNAIGDPKEFFYVVTKLHSISEAEEYLQSLAQHPEVNPIQRFDPGNRRIPVF